MPAARAVGRSIGRGTYGLNPGGTVMPAPRRCASYSSRIAARVGSAVEAPWVRAQAAPAAQAHCSVSAIGPPSAQATASAPVKASPAAVVSTASTFGAGTLSRRPSRSA